MIEAFVVSYCVCCVSFVVMCVTNVVYMIRDMRDDHDSDPIEAGESEGVTDDA